MGIILIPLFLILLGCAVPGLALLGWGAWRSRCRWLTALLGLAAVLPVAVAAHLVPFAIDANSKVYIFSFLFNVTAGTGFLLGLPATMLAMVAIWKRRPFLAAVSGVLFLAVTMQPVLWFAGSDRLMTQFNITSHY